MPDARGNPAGVVEIRPKMSGDSGDKASTGGDRSALVRNFSNALGVPQESHACTYSFLLEESHWKRPYYWICLISSCGIATLGLAQNSPAVIIGAMLLSPLMGPIVGLGMALALGDLLLGLRSMANCIISTVSVVACAALITALLPFKEATAEILARTRPNSLDLIIALFCGLVAAIATARAKSSGEGTAMPGVAIAVALVPPLCVAGWGVGAGLRWGVFRGAMVLYLTNLTAIVFLSLLVFLALGLGSSREMPAIRDILESCKDGERLYGWLSTHPWASRFRKIGGTHARVLIVGSAVLILVFPLHSGLKQVQRELFVNSEIKAAVPKYLSGHTVLSRRAVATKDGAAVSLAVIPGSGSLSGDIRSLESYLKGRIGPGVAIQYTEVAKGSYDNDRLAAAIEGQKRSLKDLAGSIRSENLNEIKKLWPKGCSYELAELSLVIPLTIEQIRIRVEYISEGPMPDLAIEMFRRSASRYLGVEPLGIECSQVPRTWGVLDLGKGESSKAVRDWVDSVKSRATTLPEGWHIRAVLVCPEGLSEKKLTMYKIKADQALGRLRDSGFIPARGLSVESATAADGSSVPPELKIDIACREGR